MLSYRAPPKVWQKLVILCIAMFGIASVVHQHHNRWARSSDEVYTHWNSSGGLEIKALVRWAEGFQRVSETLEGLGGLFYRDDFGWHKGDCHARGRLRPVTLPSKFGNLTLYVSDSDNAFLVNQALKGEILEKGEISRFLQISNPLPLVDVGASVGMVTLQAALQGRPVFAVEPLTENALRLCRSASDFGHARLVHVVRNAASSREGVVTLETGSGQEGTSSPVKVFALTLDRLLDVIPYPQVALKIDMESHEGHVLEGAVRLFQQVDVPIVWMEWEHVKKRSEHVAISVLSFLRSNRLLPYDLMSLSPLQPAQHLQWRFSVLWLREGVRVTKHGARMEISWR